LLQCQLVEVLYCSIDEREHKVVVDIRHEFLAEEEAHCDELTVEMVDLLHVAFDVTDHLGEDRELGHAHPLPAATL
jgi:hypothetical protein